MTVSVRKPAVPGPVIGPVLWAAGVVASVSVVAVAMTSAGAQLRAPDFDLLFGQSPVILAHLFAALAALLVGFVIFSRRKGSRFHRTLGWGWVVLMMATAGTSFFIMELRNGQFSLIHLLSGWVSLGVPVAVLAARRHNVNLHRRIMTGMFMGGLIIAGLFTFLPGRLLWRVFFG